MGDGCLNGEISINGATLALLSALAGILGRVIWILFALLLERTKRAEAQVDTALPQIERLADNTVALNQRIDALAERLGVQERR